MICPSAQGEIFGRVWTGVWVLCSTDKLRSQVERIIAYGLYSSFSREFQDGLMLVLFLRRHDGYPTGKMAQPAKFRLVQ